ncbi:MAG: chemotaxis protein CheC [Coriobacteriales bacterium]|nr:chemotaxis protein CheC [Coriobacteriales bacterium]
MNSRTEEEKDILREIGNIGGGNALTSLSMLLGKPLDLEIPSCSIVRRDDVGSMLDAPDTFYAGVSMTMTGTIECSLALLLNKKFTKMVMDALDEGTDDFDVTKLTDMQESALCEIGNIMGNSYVTALGTLLDLYIDVSVPHIVVDTGRHVLEQFIMAYPEQNDSLLFVSSSFGASEDRLESYMLLCPTDESLSNILARLSC